MKIWTFDPGSVATGIAWVKTDAPHWDAFQMDDVVDIHYTLHDYVHGIPSVFLIEMYRSAGHLNEHAKRTIEVIGALKLSVQVITGYKPLMVAEQARLNGQREAAELMKDDIDVLRKDPLRKDAFSALAHACAYRRRING